jgi:hypothetical protein
MIKRIWLLRFPGHVTSAVKPVNWNDVLFPKNIPSLPKFCLYSDVTPICKESFSNSTPLFLHINLKKKVKLT